MTGFLEATAFTAPIFGAVSYGNILTVGGFILSAATGVGAGRSTSNFESYNRDIAIRNATLAKQNAVIKAEQDARASKIRRELNFTRRLAAGTALEGSPLILATEDFVEDRYNQQLILREGDIKALGFEAEATSATLRGAAAEQKSFLEAGSTLLTGAGSLQSRRRPQIQGTGDPVLLAGNN